MGAARVGAGNYPNCNVFYALFARDGKRQIEVVRIPGK
jgi:hypothetical protein